MIVRRTGGRGRGRVSVRGAQGPLSSEAYRCTAAPALRTSRLPLPDPGGGFLTRMPDLNPAPRPVFRARRFHVREGERSGYRAGATPKRPPGGRRNSRKFTILRQLRRFVEAGGRDAPRPDCAR